jgi:hypothetical protein
MRWALLGTCLLLSSAAGCTTASSELRASQALYKDARYEECQRYLEALEVEVESMNERDLTRFYYLRGMTAFRLGQTDDALHYLALAATLTDEDALRLPEAWLPIMRRTLEQVTPTTASPHARSTSAL